MIIRPSRVIPGCLFVAFGLLGCGTQDLESPQLRIDTLPTGIIQVLNPSEGVWARDGGWELKETLRLGTVFGEGPSIFGSIRDVQLDRFGRIWVYEEQAEEIRVFDSTGNHIRTIGRPGEGPGEFGRVVAMDWSPDEHLWVVDPGLRRISIFDTAGTFLTSRRRANTASVYPWSGGIDRHGLFIDVEWEPGPDGEKYLVRFDTLLTPLDTVPYPKHPNGPQLISVQAGGGVARYSKPFAGAALWVLARDGGMWVALTDQYKLLRLSRTGDTLRVVTKPFKPVPVTSEDREQVLERYRRRGVDLYAFEIPDSKPAIATLFVDDEDHLWVIPVRPADGTGYVAEVFDSAGVFLGEVQVPVPFLQPPVTFRDGAVATVTSDSLGVPFVVRFRIQGRVPE